MIRWILFLYALACIRPVSIEGFLDERTRPYVEAKFGAFTFIDDILQKIYPQWSNSYGVEFGVILWRYGGVGIQYGYAKRTGQGIINGTSSHVFPIDNNTAFCTGNSSLVYQNVDVFAKFFWPITSYVKPYVGVGPRILILTIDDQLPDCCCHQTGTGVGGVFLAGMHLGWPHLYIDPFFEYGFVEMGTESACVPVTCKRHFDNFAVGSGLGFRF